jgi:hypothetical protein
MEFMPHTPINLMDMVDMAIQGSIFMAIQEWALIQIAHKLQVGHIIRISLTCRV